MASVIFSLFSAGRYESGRTLPKFGEWDVNDPASAEGFTVIFNKARADKKNGGREFTDCGVLKQL